MRLLYKLKRSKLSICAFCVLIVAIIALATAVTQVLRLADDILETELLSVNNTLVTFYLSDQWGMGNEMFALASTYGIMRSNANRVLCIDRNTFILNVFRLDKLPKCSANTLLRYFKAEARREVAYAIYDPLLSYLPVGRHVVVGRFLQSWRYFTGREDEIRKLFTFEYDLLRLAREFLTQSIESHLACRDCSNEVLKVGLHIRRGNMAESPELRKKGYKVADEAYINRAIGYLKERFLNTPVIFVVCSDDIDWAHDALQTRKDVVFVVTGRPELEMAVLSLCNHSIITVGSFGWWAAWLANGITVYYKDWPEKGTVLAATTRHMDYFPPAWIGL